MSKSTNIPVAFTKPEPYEARVFIRLDGGAYITGIATIVDLTGDTITAVIKPDRHA